MKVKVSRKYIKPQTQTVEEILHANLISAYAEIEKLVQQNKDLRVSEAHLQDELKNLRTRFADACAERDNATAAYKQVLLNSKSHEEKSCDAYMDLFQQHQVLRETKNREIAELREQVNMYLARVNELDLRNQYLEDEAAAHHEEKEAFEDALKGFEAMRKDYEAQLAEVHKEKRDYLVQCDRLQEEVARLTTERDTAVRENTTLIFENSELEENLEATVNIKNEYAEIIDSLRKERERLLARANDTTAGFWNFLVEQGLVKTGDGGTTNET